MKRMGMEDLVAADDAAYIDLAVRLAGDVQYRDAVRRTIQQRQPILFDDIACVRALEEFLLRIRV
jgi:predicted O-linked N-acetylglucosamine transferase (SPINDLY family)